MWLLEQRSLRTANQIYNWTIFSRAATRSRMKMYTPKNKPIQKTLEYTEI